MLEIKNIDLSYQKKKVIKGLSVKFSSGEFCALLGPNGAGKSTLLKALIRYLPIENGQIFYKGRDYYKWSRQQLAKEIAIIPQDYQFQFDYTVKELILMGRFPYLNYLQNYSKEDMKIVEMILTQLDLNHMEDKLYSCLSGGERRRVLIARALAQKTDILLMDEAFANLDINHQLEIMQLLWKINKNQQKLIILVSHNINLASEYCDRIIMLKKGEIIADGKPSQIIKPQNLELLYSSHIEVIKNPITHKPNLIYPGKNEN